MKWIAKNKGVDLEENDLLKETINVSKKKRASIGNTANLKVTKRGCGYFFESVKLSV